MDFKMVRPCDSCPFLKRGGIILTKARAREIAMTQAHSQGGSFACHKTVDYDGGSKTQEQYCAGALAFSENVGTHNQFLRIMGRLGAFDPSRIEGHDRVFGSVRAMVAAHGKRRA